LATTSSRLEFFFVDVSHFERLVRPTPGSWSCQEIAGHLVDAELSFAYRIRTALAQSGFALQPFDENAWVAAQNWNEANLDDILTTFATLRRSNLQIFRSLDDESWTRHYVHAERGVQTLAATALLLQYHDHRHLVQLGRTSQEARDASRAGV
jgi:hypothetical protein